ncbi:MAG TPA: LysM peptidoglycan-binding domain-containing protein [Bacillales bacterium]
MQYVIQPGDTLYAIAGRYNISLNALREANPGIDPYHLYVGQEIWIPINQTRYVVKKGDTLYKIANRFGITLNSLLAANPQLELNEYIYPGQVINVPLQSVREYAVQPGDTLLGIANTFGVTVDQILQINPQIANPNLLYVGQVIRIPRPQSTTIVQTNQEYGYVDLVEDLTALQNRYSFIHVEVIGQSVMGKNIYAIRLGEGPKEVFYSGAWHANEWLTTPVLMKFVEQYAQAYQNNQALQGYDIQYLFNNMSIWLVPLVNPDGVELVQEGITPSHPFYEEVLQINNGSRNFSDWTANIHGVDLNHQWPAAWEEEAATSPDHPSPSHYGGPYPLSEPETQAVAEFTRNHDFRMVLAYHSQGQVIYWGFRGLAPEESEGIVERFAVLSGYEPVRLAGSGAGYKDWFIQEYRRPGFTIEVGLGKNPLPISQFDGIYRRNLPVLLEAPLL